MKEITTYVGVDAHKKNLVSRLLRNDERHGISSASKEKNMAATTTAPKARESHRKLKPKPGTEETSRANSAHGTPGEADGARGETDGGPLLFNSSLSKHGLGFWTLRGVRVDRRLATGSPAATARCFNHRSPRDLAHTGKIE